ncbi:MAG: DUF1266 domain-containing protein [Xanthomonadales bacterium]|nr:DUF1266 domain-containing protein [Xanthomonadales bacterium]
MSRRLRPAPPRKTQIVDTGNAHRSTHRQARTHGMEDTQLLQILAGTGVGLALAASSAWLAKRRWQRSDERWRAWFPEAPDVPENPELTRELAVGAVLGVNNAFPVNTLDPHKPRAEMRTWLADFWNTRNAAQARECVQSLLMEGHSATFDLLIDAASEGDPDVSREHLEQVFVDDLEHNPELAEFIAHHPEAIARLEALGYLVTQADVERGTRAYDLGRAVVVSRVAFGAGYFNRAEAMTMIRMAAFVSQRTFKSWREFATSYLLGRALWGGVDEPDFEGMVRIVEELLRNPRSPWQRCGWFR